MNSRKATPHILFLWSTRSTPRRSLDRLGISARSSVTYSVMPTTSITWPGLTPQSRNRDIETRRKERGHPDTQKREHGRKSTSSLALGLRQGSPNLGNQIVSRC
ncbi:hypothetical protein CDEST_02848 [Colletotrichum destructivum]|uniref:Uncharacterized protein n=1 Tax=Colletotrichum destructivum TaxID=34406 RepID=A0AAX4I3I6_9PEZI|nr:hypothetical protein CDEST_02848 [Colletotrichum destructivum]